MQVLIVDNLWIAVRQGDARQSPIARKKQIIFHNHSFIFFQAGRRIRHHDQNGLSFQLRAKGFVHLPE
jgi:hypothetical protein